MTLPEPPVIETPNNLKSKWGVVVLLMGLVLALFLTHIGAQSPYTYGIPLVYPDQKAPNMDGHHVNWDCPNYSSFSKFLCGWPMNVSMYGLSYSVATFPIPPFCASIFLGITRSYLFSFYVTNLVAMFLLTWAYVNFCRQRGISYSIILVAGTGFLLLPFFAHYLAQPMMYICGTCLHFILVMAFLNLCHLQRKNPIELGLLASIMTLNYDWYVYVGAVILYLLFIEKFPQPKDYFVFFFALITLYFIWSTIKEWLNVPQAINSYSASFLQPVIEAWITYLQHPIDLYSLPFHASHIGLTVAFRQITAYIYWPLLLFTSIFMVIFFHDYKQSRLFKFSSLMLGLFVAEQMGTALFDWENNTRRAIPVLFIFAASFTYVLHRTWQNRQIKITIAALFFLSAAMTFADYIVKDPSIAATQYGESIRSYPKFINNWYQRRITPENIKNLPKDSTLELGKGPRGKVEAGHYDTWIFCNLTLGLALLAFFYFMAQAALVPLWSPYAYLFLFTTSLIVRFL